MAKKKGSFFRTLIVSVLLFGMLGGMVFVSLTIADKAITPSGDDTIIDIKPGTDTPGTDTPAPPADEPDEPENKTMSFSVDGQIYHADSGTTWKQFDEQLNADPETESLIGLHYAGAVGNKEGDVFLKSSTGWVRADDAIVDGARYSMLSPQKISYTLYFDEWSSTLYSAYDCFTWEDCFLSDALRFDFPQELKVTVGELYLIWDNYPFFALNEVPVKLSDFVVDGGIYMGLSTVCDGYFYYGGSKYSFVHGQTFADWLSFQGYNDGFFSLFQGYVFSFAGLPIKDEVKGTYLMVTDKISHNSHFVSDTAPSKEIFFFYEDSSSSYKNISFDFYYGSDFYHFIERECSGKTTFWSDSDGTVRFGQDGKVVYYKDGRVVTQYDFITPTMEVYLEGLLPGMEGFPLPEPEVTMITFSLDGLSLEVEMGTTWRDLDEQLNADPETKSLIGLQYAGIVGHPELLVFLKSPTGWVRADDTIVDGVEYTLMQPQNISFSLYRDEENILTYSAYDCFTWEDYFSSENLRSMLPPDLDVTVGNLYLKWDGYPLLVCDADPVDLKDYIIPNGMYEGHYSVATGKLVVNSTTYNFAPGQTFAEWYRCFVSEKSDFFDHGGYVMYRSGAPLKDKLYGTYVTWDMELYHNANLIDSSGDEMFSLYESSSGHIDFSFYFCMDSKFANFIETECSGKTTFWLDSDGTVRYGQDGKVVYHKDGRVVTQYDFITPTMEIYLEGVL